ncbi:MAG: hypothetical protein M1835_007000, partial [Candelina submexicana]
MSKRESPHFMSPTVASRAQTATSQPDHSRSMIPKPESASSAKGRNWVASTAKLVGLGRVDEGLSRSKKVIKEPATEETFINQMSFPRPSSCKPMAIGSAPSGSGRPSFVDKPLPSEKPLPSPPVLQIAQEGPSTDEDGKPNIQRKPASHSEISSSSRPSSRLLGQRSQRIASE